MRSVPPSEGRTPLFVTCGRKRGGIYLYLPENVSFCVRKAAVAWRVLVPRCAGLRLVPIAWSGEKVRESSPCCLCGTVVRLKCNSFGLQGVASKSVSPNGNFGIKRNEPLDIFSIMGLDFLPVMSILSHFSLLTQRSPMFCRPLLRGWETGCLRDPSEDLLPSLFSHAPC